MDTPKNDDSEVENSKLHVCLLVAGSIALIAGASALMISHRQHGKTNHEAPAPSPAATTTAAQTPGKSNSAPSTVAESIKDGELNLHDRIDLTDKDLACLKNLKTVKTLNLTGCTGLTDAAMDTIVSLPLTTLFMYGTKFSPAAYAKLPLISSLEILNAGGSDFDDSDASAVSKMKTLTELRLPRSPKLTPAALKSIASMTWLDKLALPADNIEPSLSSLGSLHLTVLNLAGDKVTNADVNMLAQKIRTLSTLNIRENPVTDQILAEGSPVSTLPDLKNLSIAETGISHEAGDKFGASHKNCKVMMSDRGTRGKFEQDTSK